MKKLISLIGVAISTAVCANTRLGLFSLTEIRNSEDNVAIGKYAGNRIKESSNNTLVGDGAGLAATNINDSIGIGSDVLLGARNLRGTVAIGNGELAGVGGLNDTTSINRQQIFVSRPANAFAINPLQKENITETPLYYLNDTLHFNVANIEGIALSRTEPLSTYDFYLAPDGNDTNDGLSYKRPKKTFDGVWRAANELGESITNVTCAVFPGTYYVDYTNTVVHMPTGQHPIPSMYRVNKRVHFKAIEGPGKTCLSAIPESLDREDGVFVSLGVSMLDSYFSSTSDADFLSSRDGVVQAGIYRRQTLEGFTVKNFAATFGKNIQRTAPTFSGFDFRNCIITDNYIMQSGWGYGGIFACRFYDCEIKENVIQHTGGSSPCYLFNFCEFYNSSFAENLFYIPDGYTGEMKWIRSQTTADNSYFNIAIPANSSDNQIKLSFSRFVNSTLYAVTEEGTRGTFWTGNNNTTNCLFVFDVPVTTTTYGVENIWTDKATFVSTHDIATGVATSIESPAVRLEAKPDVGWKDSGLNTRKILSTRADIRVVEDSLVVYLNGEIVGTIPMDAVAMTYARPASKAPAESNPAEPQVEELDEENAVKIAPKLKKL